MFKLFILLCLFFCIVSCNKPATDVPGENNFYKVDSIQGKYLFSNEEPVNYLTAAGTAYITYNISNKIIKRRGGYIPIPTTSGSSYFYVKEVFDTIRYIANGNVVIDLSTSLSGISFTGGGRREIILSNNLVSKRISYNQESSNNDNDTTVYFYDAANRVQRTEQYLFSTYYVKNFFFDSNGNLVKTTGIRKRRSDNTIINTTEEVFSGFDNQPNPLKLFNFWDDTFLRSLSNNNFTGYSYIKKDQTNNIIKQEQKNWTLVYDAGGIPDFSK
jgi:hypothetical protein